MYELDIDTWDHNMKTGGKNLVGSLGIADHFFRTKKNFSKSKSPYLGSVLRSVMILLLQNMQYKIAYDWHLLRVFSLFFI